MKLNTNNLGLSSEKRAAHYLTQQGLILVTSNYHCRFGEIDLIMQDSDTLVFVEVRLRRNSRFGNAAASITPQKQQKLIATAQYYLQYHPTQQACRFDAVLMDKSRDIEWITNAFGL